MKQKNLWGLFFMFLLPYPMGSLVRESTQEQRLPYNQLPVIGPAALGFCSSKITEHLKEYRFSFSQVYK
jgi:hypothetical protein